MLLWLQYYISPLCLHFRVPDEVSKKEASQLKTQLKKEEVKAWMDRRPGQESLKMGIDVIRRKEDREVSLRREEEAEAALS